MLKNVNKLHNFEACLHFLASKCLLTQVGMDYNSNKVARIYQDDSSIPIGALNRKFSN